MEVVYKVLRVAALAASLAIFYLAINYPGETPYKGKIENWWDSFNEFHERMTSRNVAFARIVASKTEILLGKAFGGESFSREAFTTALGIFGGVFVIIEIFGTHSSRLILLILAILNVLCGCAGVPWPKFSKAFDGGLRFTIIAILVASQGILFAIDANSVPSSLPIAWKRDILDVAVANGVGAWMMTVVVYISRFAITKNSVSEFYWLRVLALAVVLLSCFYIGWFLVDWKEIPSWWINHLPPNPSPVGRMIGYLLILAADGLSVAIPVLAISLSFILLLGVVISALMLIDLIVRAYAVRLIYHAPRVLENKKVLLTVAAVLLGVAFHADLGALRKAIVGW